MKQEFPYNEMKASCRETIKKDIKKIENGFTSIWFFPTCSFGQSANRDRLWDCRDVYRVTTTCFYQWRYHACFFRRVGIRFLSWDESDPDGNVVFRTLRIRGGVGEQDAECA